MTDTPRRTEEETKRLILLVKAWNGDLEGIIQLLNKGFPWDEEVIAYAIEPGHLNVLQWAHQEGKFIVDAGFVEYARSYGHAHIVAWATVLSSPGGSYNVSTATQISC